MNSKLLPRHNRGINYASFNELVVACVTPDGNLPCGTDYVHCTGLKTVSGYLARVAKYNIRFDSVKQRGCTHVVFVERRRFFDNNSHTFNLNIYPNMRIADVEQYREVM